jgi:hypothetical protein
MISPAIRRRELDRYRRYARGLPDSTFSGSACRWRSADELIGLPDLIDLARNSVPAGFAGEHYVECDVRHLERRARQFGKRFGSSA